MSQPGTLTTASAGAVATDQTNNRASSKQQLTFSPTRREEDHHVVTDEKLARTRQEIDNANCAMNDEISNLNEKLDERLKKQEHDYLKGYSLYVK
jgi:hypothetical protein